jgi:hypothetical protein
MRKKPAEGVTKRTSVRSSNQNEFYVQELIRFHNGYPHDPGYQKAVRELWRNQPQPFYHEALRRLEPSSS